MAFVMVSKGMRGSFLANTEGLLQAVDPQSSKRIWERVEAFNRS